MTTLALADDDARCSSCGARAGSCTVRQWLSGRRCCPTCTGHNTHQSGGVHGDPGHHEHHDHDLVHLDHDDHDDHNQMRGQQ